MIKNVFKRKSREVSEHPYAMTALEVTLDNLDTLIYINEIDTGKILFINKKMLKEFGGELKEFIGRPCWKVLQKDFDKRCSFCPIPKLMKTGETSLVWEEYNTVTNRYYQNTDSLIKWVDGRTVHMQHSVDITERKMIEMKVEEVISRLEAVMANYPGILISLDMDKICTMASGSQLSEFGLEKEELIGNNIYEVMPSYKAELDRALNAAYNGMPTRWIMKIGKGDYNCFQTPLYNDKGKIVGALFAANDISNTVKNQNELKKAMELAQQGSKAKSDFLSRMSHEIRTPMNAIIGMTQVAKETYDIEKIHYCVENIDTSAHHLLELINDVLDLSRIESNKMKFEHERFNLEKMLMNVNSIVIEKADSKKQRLNVFIDHNMNKYFVGDDFKISQVLINLISNAIKFTPEDGEINVSVKEIGSNKENTTIVFTVADTGIGVTEEQKSRIFRSFEQADGSTARKYGGTGLGLAISKNIVEKMGGRVWVDSEPDKGSSFGFELSLGNTDEQDSGNWGGCSIKNLRVLVIDDSQEVCDYFLKIMEKFEIKAEAALSGAQALEMISKAYMDGQPYSVIFVDWRMPEMDGIETIRKIREANKDDAIIIMISASEWIEIEDKARSVGITKFIPKPLFPSLILNTISESVGGISKEQQNDGQNKLYDFSKVNVLLVEDIKVNQEVFKALLDKTNVNVDTADDGMEAVMKFQENTDKYDIIFMDVQMPEMDGYEATRKIRAMDDIDRAKNIPIIAMTANVFKEDIDKCLECGMNSHLGKPIDRDNIIEKILLYAPSKVDNKLVMASTQDRFDGIDKYMPYFDLEDFKSRLGCDEDTCKTLLKAFLENDDAEDLLRALEEGHIDKAKEAVHKLKGIAGNLSLKELYIIATDFDKNIEDKIGNPTEINKLKKIIVLTKETVNNFAG